MRPARALPYAFDASARRTKDGLLLAIANSGAAGAGFAVYPANAAAGGPWYYAVEAGKTLSDTLPVAGTGYDFILRGPNGFMRHFRGDAADAIEVNHLYEPSTETFKVTLRNKTEQKCNVLVTNAYDGSAARTLSLESNAETTGSWDIANAGHWYDISVTVAGDSVFLRRLAGHIETGRTSTSDPALDWPRT